MKFPRNAQAEPNSRQESIAEFGAAEYHNLVHAGENRQGRLVRQSDNLAFRGLPDPRPNRSRILELGWFGSMPHHLQIHLRLEMPISSFGIVPQRKVQKFG